MRRAIDVVPNGGWDVGDASATVTLAFDDRHRRRLTLTDDAGAPFLLDFDRPRLLGDGDGLVLAEGGIIAVRAAAEPVADARASNAAALARLAWHIGNRHAPVQVLDEGALRIRDDAVLVTMLEGLGAQIRRHVAPFAPEGGAYAATHRHEDATASAAEPPAEPH